MSEGGSIPDHCGKNNIFVKIYPYRFNVKLCALVLCLVYYCVLRGELEDSGGYSSSKEYCISEKRRCPSTNADYGSGDYDGLEYFPICYLDSIDNFCVGTQAFSCLYGKRRRHRNVDIEDEALPIRHDYYEYSVVIIIFSVFACIGTLLFQSKLLGITFIQDGSQFSSSVATDMLIDKFISACSVICFALMIASSEHFSFMMREKCNENSNVDFCQDLASCGLEIRSIIFPSNWLAREYNILSLLIGLLVLLSEFFTIVYPPNHDETLVNEGIRIRQMTIRTTDETAVSGIDHNASNALVYIVQTPRGSRVSRRYMSSISSPRPSQVLTPERYVQQHQAFKQSHVKQLKNWKYNVSLSKISEEEECAICLETFHCHTKKENRNPTTVQAMKFKPKMKSAAIYPVEEDEITNNENDEGDDFKSKLMMSIVQIPCGHMFHELCVFEWIRENSTCPVCRANTSNGEV